MRYVRAFGHFWWDFLVGDTPELFVATLFLVGLALLLRHAQSVAVPVLIAAAVSCIAVSSWRGRKRSVARAEPEGAGDVE